MTPQQEQIKHTIESAGWMEVENMFFAEILNCTDVKNISSKLSPEEYKLDAMSRTKASKIVQRVFRKLDKIRNYSETKKVVYR